MKNHELYQKNPKTFDLLNNGVSKVTEVAADSEQLRTLRFELETFVCDGEYGSGLERILTSFLSGLDKPEQQATWVSGFFGSGKSHLVKMLRYLWVDFTFPDGASARSLANLPTEVRDLLTELSNRGRYYGGLDAASGTLGAGSMDNVRMAFLQLIFRAKNLPENLSAARFVLWLRHNGFLDSVINTLKMKGLNPDREIQNFFVSPPLAEALVAANPDFATPNGAQAALRAQFPMKDSPTIDDVVGIISQVFSRGDQMPLTLLVVDEIQQYIGGGGTSLQRAMDVQEIAEHCSSDFKSRLMLVGTGQSALTGTQSLSRLQARYTIKVPLSDADVENVIRKTILAKKPERNKDIKNVIDTNQGEISRHLHKTRLAATTADEAYYAPDYPLLPVRRRFWEKVLRNVDESGTTAQLRTQLKIVFDAARESADWDLGHVIPADFIYDQISTDLLNTGTIQREYHETIIGLRDGTPQGELKSRLCALMFLISQLPQKGAADDGVRSDAETLVDLLVKDLAKDGTELRGTVPDLLQELVSAGKIILVDDQYRLQTRVSAEWMHDFNRRRVQILNDEPRLAAERELDLKIALDKELKSLRLTHGASGQPRELEVVFSSSRPAQGQQKLILWLRHGWGDQEKEVSGSAKAAGNTDPMIYGFLPRVNHEEIRQAIAAVKAAEETLVSQGTPTTAEAIEACNAIKTQQQVALVRLDESINQILAQGKIFLGGGTEGSGIELVDKVKNAAASALQRLFPEFSEADHGTWSQVLNTARAGNIGALQHVKYQGETIRHPACKRIYDFIGAGKKGKEVREHFRTVPFGWPQDAIDASLVMLTLSGNLRATHNGQPVTAKDLNQTQISGASFYVDVPPLTVTQRLELKALLKKLAIETQNGQEAASALIFLQKLRELADSAGGEEPLPAMPDTAFIKKLQQLSGNAQLVEIHGDRDRIIATIDDWTKTVGSIAKRRPRWKRLIELREHAAGLPEAVETAVSIDAVRSSRNLLGDPDPVPPLIQTLVDLLRKSLRAAQDDLQETHRKQTERLEESVVWQSLSDQQRAELVTRFKLEVPGAIQVSDEDEILNTLKEASLANRRLQVEALPSRFQQALDEASRLLEPTATHLSLPSATIRNEDDLEGWIDQVRELVKNQLSEGPVVL